ncbi:putative chromatin regulator PHD family [Helianthus annuus]|uniref:Chromatin regulator PHD family n=1 Tax=Helianthus annuus TaxID=4232 RepID=A0A9K3ENL7_HELAN|nr:putative chromatin regulator PHD family [Helianthus annuus]
MDSSIVVMDPLHHFDHEHPLYLVHLPQQAHHKNENADDEDEDEVEDEVEFVEEDRQCNLCKEQIWSFHLCYYSCKTCNYSLHKFCAELHRKLQNHPLHPGRHLSFSSGSSYGFKCFLCNLMQKSICGYRCVNLECALLPTKLLIQNHTDGSFTHSHPLTLAYSFPYLDILAKYLPLCRVCGHRFYSHLWIYKCDKCLYYVHVDCATSKREPFMSIFQTASLGKTYKNFKEDEYPNLLHCPFQDEGDNLLKRYMSNQHKLIGDSKQHGGEMLTHASHQHALILFDKQTPAGASLHDPMKRIQLLCDGCVKPIMTVPFYVCCQYDDEQYCFVLHEWCAKLPAEVQEYVGHLEHTLVLLPKIPSKFFGVFKCAVCELPSNGFSYGCTICNFYVDINCAFIPKEITHDAHPNHLLSIVKPSDTQSEEYCKACGYWVGQRNLVYHCSSCNFYIDVECALLLPRVIKHKLDKHPLNLRYEPAENHTSEYFCEICEYQFTPWEWFYHCTTCAQSVHAACVPLILQCEQNTYADNRKCVYEFLNVKFGGTLEIKDHSHSLAFVQGLESDGRCSKCRNRLQYKMIFKCLECEYALHFECASSSVN